MSSVVFAAFDERRGPVSVFSTVNKELATKVAVKSIVSTLSQITADTANKIEGEAIIPFPDEKLVAFIYYTSLDEKIVTGDRRVISLSCLTDSQKVNMLYQNAPRLSSKAHEIGNMINKSYKHGAPLNTEIAKELQSWGSLDEATVAAPTAAVPVEEVMGLFQVFEFYPIKKKVDPIASFLLGLLYNMPVVLSGSDPKFLIEISTIMGKLFEMKELRIQLTIPLGEEATGWTQKIPRADIVALQSDQYARAFFSKDPVVIITHDAEVRTPNHKFEDSHLSFVTEWLKKARAMKSTDFAMRTIQLEIASLTKKLEQLVELAMSNKQYDTKDVIKLLNSSKIEIEILIEIIRGYKYIGMDKINKLLSPKTPYRDIWIQGPTTIGFIR